MTREPDRNEENDRRFHDVPYIAWDMGVSEKQVRRYIARGELVAHHFGRLVRISVEDYADFLTRHRRGKSNTK